MWHLPGKARISAPAVTSKRQRFCSSGTHARAQVPKCEDNKLWDTDKSVMAQRQLIFYLQQ